METVNVSKNDFGVILSTAEILINKVEDVLSQDEVAEKRAKDVFLGRVKGKTKEDYNEYLKKRGV